MAIKLHKPVTPARRGTKSIVYRDLLSGNKPHKPLVRGGKRGVGRASFGKITTRHKGGGHKRSQRMIDFKYDKRDVPAKYETLEYDPNRSGFIALALYADGERRYVLAPRSAKVGGSFVVGETAPVAPGNRLPLKNIPTGTFVYNVEVKPGAGAKLARSAGNYAIVQARDAGYVTLKMPSSEIRKVLENSWASVGEVSNPERNLRVIGKAGRNRWRGIRPTVRGMAMNPVDHPMGGGEARGRGRRKRKKMYSGKVVDPLKKTRRPRKYSNKLIVQRRKSKAKKSRA